MSDTFCFICGAGTPGTVYLTASSWACRDHLDGTGQPYLENGGQID